MIFLLLLRRFISIRLLRFRLSKLRDGVWGSSVSPNDWGSIRGTGKRFFIWCLCLDWLPVLPSLLSRRYQRSFPWGYSAADMTLTTQPCLVLRSGMCRSYFLTFNIRQVILNSNLSILSLSFIYRNQNIQSQSSSSSAMSFVKDFHIMECEVSKFILTDT